MTFPALAISTKKWITDDLMDYILWDEYIYTNKESVFQKYYKDNLFCDGEGKIYKAIRKNEVTENWRNWLRFIPNVWKTTIIFQDMNEEMSVEQLRNYILERISDLKQDTSTREWKINVQKATTHAELIQG